MPLRQAQNGSREVMKSFICLVCAALVLSGCASSRLVGRPDLQIVPGDALPAPSREDLIVQRREYVVGPFDRVDISVFGVPELTRTVQLDANGRFSLPLVGEIQAAGYTPQQLGEEIASRLRGRYVRDPQVAVNADTVNQMVTVDGEVNEPGMYPVTGRMTLMRAVARAKGVTEFANTNFVVVFRRVNDREMAALYDLRSIRQGVYGDPEIYANDVIYVGESQARRLFASFLQGASALSYPIVALIR
jgi:polysaccharide export outer membrane protein